MRVRAIFAALVVAAAFIAWFTLVPHTEVPVGAVRSLMLSDAGVQKCVWQSFGGKPEALAARLRADALDLNDDGQIEWRIYTDGVGCFCGNGDDSCVQWIVGKFGEDYRDLEAYGEPLDTRSHGYRDLVTEVEVEGDVFWRTLYQFDGKRYQKTQCSIRADKKGYEPLSCKAMLELAMQGRARP